MQDVKPYGFWHMKAFTTFGLFISTNNHTTMKKLLTLFFFFVFALSAMADDLVMQIQKVDGQRLFVYLEDQPLVSFSEGKLLVQTTKETISLPLSMVKKYTFESIQDGIENLRNTEVVIKREGETLTITGLDKKAVIGVFASSGKLMKVAMCEVEN